MEKIAFTGENGDSIDFYVLEKTTLGGFDFMLVTEQETGDSEAYILKEVSKTNESEGVYEIVTDEAELDAVGQVFANLLEDIDLME